MGLTVHYDISFPASKEKEMLQKLEEIKEKCLTLPFAKVFDVVRKHYTKENVKLFRDLIVKYMYPNNSKENLQKRNNILKKNGIDLWDMICLENSKNGPKSEYEVISSGVWAGEGSESTTLTLSKEKNVWEGHGFTKTGYAKDFVKSHLLVIQFLDMLKENGFNVIVHDESNYWEKRDISLLE